MFVTLVDHNVISVQSNHKILWKRKKKSTCNIMIGQCHQCHQSQCHSNVTPFSICCVWPLNASDWVIYFYYFIIYHILSDNFGGYKMECQLHFFAQIQREFFAFLPYLPTTMSRAKQVITCKGISLHFLLFLNYRENNISYYWTFNI